LSFTVLVACSPRESVIATCKPNDPTASGVPLMEPLAASKDNPGGRPAAVIV
jgi:hypothetical protein